MPVLTSFEILGNADELLAQKQAKVDPIMIDLAKEHGAIGHMVAKTDNGLIVFNVWETLEGSEKVADIVRPQAMEFGLPAPSNWKSYDLVQVEGAIKDLVSVLV